MLLAGASGVAAASGDEAGEIVWGVLDFAPYSIPSGPHQGEGIRDKILEVLKEQLPQYRHREVQASAARIFSSMQEGRPWCMVGAVKVPEREAFGYFSLPAQVHLPQGVVVRKSRLAQFEALGELSMDKLLAQASLRTSFHGARSYPPEVREAMDRQPQVRRHTGDAEPIRMILADRLDYAIEFPLIASYYAKQLGQEGELAVLPLREMPDSLAGRVMCTKNEWGARVIERVDEVLRLLRPTPRYRLINERWYSQGDVQRVRRLYEPMLLKSD
nr:TIGR02285 family protein [Aquabacterium terrae]